jgi:hypothetical protein
MDQTHTAQDRSATGSRGSGNLRTYLFVVYWTTVTTASSDRATDEWFWKGYRIQRSWANLRSYTNICLQTTNAEMVKIRQRRYVWKADL